MNTTSIIFIPTEGCNLKCWYCSRNCNTNTNVYECGVSEFKNIIDFIDKQDRHYVDFEFFGGEPTTHHLLKQMTHMLSTYFTDRLVRLEVLTNLIKPIDYYSTGWADQLKWSCSYHSDCGDGDEWMEKVNVLNDLGLLGDVKMVMTPDNEDYIADLFMRHKDNNYRIYEILPQEQLEGTEWADNLTVKYGDFIFDYIGDYKPQTNYKGMVCSAGYKISQDGDVYHCWRKFNDDKAKPILNVFKDTIEKIPVWHLCSYDDCDINDVEFPKKTLKELGNEKKRI